MLQDKVIGIYCWIDDFLKGPGHYECPQTQVSDSEIITTALIPALYFKGNHSHGSQYMRTHRMIPQMINKSGFSKTPASTAIIDIMAVSGNRQTIQIYLC